jgi:uncharacterized protein
MAANIYDKLRTLQDILSRKFEVEKEIEEIPKSLATKTELLNRIRKSYTDKSSSFQEVQNRIVEISARLAEAEQAREQYESQMDAIKTQREYEALDKEIKEATEKEQNLRKDLQREENLRDELKGNLEKEEMMIQKQEEEVKEEQSKIKLKVKDKTKEFKSLQGEEKKATPGIDEEILFKFERIIRSKAGVGIVALQKGVCSGCYMILPPEFVNTVRTGENVMFCPYCSRILFYSDDTDEDTIEAGGIDEDVEDEEDDAEEEQEEEAGDDEEDEL